MENNAENNTNEQKPTEKPQEKKSFKPLLLIITIILLLCFLGFGFLYWLQMKPENKESLERMTGTDLSTLDSFAQSLGNQANSVLGKTPLGDALLNQTPVQPQAENTSSTATIPNEDELETVIIGESSETQTTPLDTSEASSTSTEEAQARSPQTPEEENIIQPPSNVQELELVTEASEEAQAAQDEEERLKAIAEIEALLASQNQASSLTQENSANTASFNGPVDNVIGASFIQNIANYLVENYNTDNGIETSPIALNIHYGTSMAGLPSAGNLIEARNYVLNYIYNPQTLNSLYNTYEERFIFELDKAAKEKNLSSSEQEKMYYDYASFLKGTASCLQSILYVNQRQEKAEELLRVKNEEKQSQEKFAVSQIAFEEAKSSGANTDAYKEAMIEASKEIEVTSARLAVTKAGILNDIKAHTNPQFSDNTLLYAFEWLHRRDQNGQDNANEANLELILLLYKLAERLEN